MGLLVMSRVAAAQPTPVPEERGEPAPIAMPNLSLHSRIATKVSAGVLVDTPGALAGTTLELDGRYALDNAELFGRVAARANVLEAIGDTSRSVVDVAVGNTVVGGRYVASVDRIAVSPSLWTWLPTASSSSRAWRSETKLAGVADAREFDGGAAVGIAIDAAWRTPCGFVQIEGGAVIVPGFDVDKVFAAIGAGQRVSTNTSLIVELRGETFPAQCRRRLPNWWAPLDAQFGGGVTVSVESFFSPAWIAASDSRPNPMRSKIGSASVTSQVAKDRAASAVAWSG
jgi:hypothetical protein